jgi:hypothetical protein
MMVSRRIVLDAHDNLNKDNPRNREPDAFIQLNMQIVRVAYSSFTTHVSRDSCILSIKVMLLLQSNSEEIDQTSFVQHQALV